MKLIKTYLRSKMSQRFLISLMKLGIETELAGMITNEQIIERFHFNAPR